jgi:hypothetical protein
MRAYGYQSTSQKPAGNLMAANEKDPSDITGNSKSILRNIHNSILVILSTHSRTTGCKKIVLATAPPSCA